MAHARELVGLEAPDSALAGGLDTLERRKLLLAGLLQRPTSVLLMDEPCSGLLADEIDEIDAVIRRIVEERGCAVSWSSIGSSCCSRSPSAWSCSTPAA